MMMDGFFLSLKIQTCLLQACHIAQRLKLHATLNKLLTSPNNPNKSHRGLPDHRFLLAKLMDVFHQQF